MNKLSNLLDWFNNKSSVLVSLSGGVDSALVAYAAFQKLGGRSFAVTADYKTLAKEELDTSKNIADEIGIKHIIINYNELENENFVQNDSNRCFYCRDELSEKLIQTAKQLKVDVIVDGTHIDEPEVSYYQTSQFSLHPKEIVTLNIDGEIMGSTPFLAAKLGKHPILLESMITADFFEYPTNKKNILNAIKNTKR